MDRVVRLALAATCLAAAPLAAQAPGVVTKTWLTSGTSAFDDGANWNPAGAPGATDVVSIPSGGTQPVLATATSFAELQLAGTLTVNDPAAVLDVTGNAFVDGMLVATDGTTTIGGALVVTMGTISVAAGESVAVTGAATATDATYVVNGDLTAASHTFMGTSSISGAAGGDLGGALSIQGGTTTYAAASALADFDSLQIGGGSTFVVSANAAVAGAVAVNGTLQVDAMVTLTANGAAPSITAAGGSVFDVVGTLSATNGATFTQSSTIQGGGDFDGAITISGGTTLVTAAMAAFDSIAVQMNASFFAAENNSVTGALTIDGGGLVVGATFTFTANGPAPSIAVNGGVLDLVGVVAATNGIEFVGLSRFQGMTGGEINGNMTVVSGTTNYGPGSDLAAFDAIDVQSGATLSIESNGSMNGALTTTGGTINVVGGVTFAANGAAPSIDVDGGVLDVDGALDAMNGTEFSGTSMLQGAAGGDLDGAVAVTGGTTTYTVGSALAALESLDVQAGTFAAEASLDVTGAVDVGGTLTIAAGTTFTANAASPSVLVDGGTLVVDGVLTPMVDLRTTNSATLDGDGSIGALTDVVGATAVAAPAMPGEALTVADLRVDAALTLTGDLEVAGAAVETTATGTISGAGDFVFVGAAGSQVLRADGMISAPVRVAGGAGADVRLHAMTPMVTLGGTFELASGSLLLVAGDVLTVNGAATLSGGLLDLDGIFTATPDVTVTGAVQYDGSNGSVNSPIVVSSGATLTVVAGASVKANGAAPALTVAGALVVDGVLDAAMGTTFNGMAATLAGAAGGDLDGDVTVAAGDATYQAGSALADLETLTINGGATFVVAENLGVTGAVVVAGTLQVSDATKTLTAGGAAPAVTVNGGELDLTGTLAAATVEVMGSGAFKGVATGSVTGAVTILTGASATAPMGEMFAIGGALQIQTMASLQCDGAASAAGAVDVVGMLAVASTGSFSATAAAPSVTVSGALTVSGPLSATNGIDATGSAAFDGAGTGAVTGLTTIKAGASATVAMGAAFAFDAVTIEATAQLTSSGAPSATGAVMVAGSLIVPGAFSANGAAPSLAASTAVVDVDGTLTVQNGATFSGACSLNGTGDLAGSASIATGTTTVGAGETPTITGALTIAGGGAALVVDGDLTVEGDADVDGMISGAGTLDFGGAGATTLDGASTIGVPTTFVSGTRTVLAASSFQFTAPTTIDAGATLSVARTMLVDLTSATLTVNGELEVAVGATATSSVVAAYPAAAIIVRSASGGPAPNGVLDVQGRLTATTGGVLFGGAMGAMTADATTFSGDSGGGGLAIVDGPINVDVGTTTVPFGEHAVATGIVTVRANGVLRVDGTFDAINDVSVTNDATMTIDGAVNASADVAVAPAPMPGMVNGAGVLTLVGAGMQELSGALGVAVNVMQQPGGTVTLSTGTVDVNADVNVLTGTLDVALAKVLNVNGILDVGAGGVVNVDGQLNVQSALNFSGATSTLSGAGEVVGAVATLFGNVTTVPAGSSLDITGTLAVNAGSDLEVDGDLDVSGGVFVGGLLRVLATRTFSANAASAPAVTLVPGVAANDGRLRIEATGALNASMGLVTSAPIAPTAGKRAKVDAFGTFNVGTSIGLSGPTDFDGAMVMLGVPLTVNAGGEAVFLATATYQTTFAVANSGTLQVVGTLLAGGAAPGVAVTGGTLVVDGPAGVLTATNGVQFDGVSALQGASGGDLVGAVAIATGTTTSSIDAAAGGLDQLDVASGAAFVVASDLTVSGTTDVDGSLTVNNGATFTVIGVPLTATGAVLDVLGTGAVVAATGIDLFGMTTLRGDATGSYDGATAVKTGATVSVPAGEAPHLLATLTVETGATLSLDGTLSAAAAEVFGTAALTGAATGELDAPTTIKSGATTAIAAGRQFRFGSTLDVELGAQLGAAGTVVCDDLLGIAGALEVAAGASFTSNGAATSTGTLTVLATGSFDAAAPASPGLSVQGGTVDVDGTLAGVNGVSFDATATLDGTGTISAPLTVAVGTTTVAMAANLTATGAFVLAAAPTALVLDGQLELENAATFDGAISGAGQLRFDGAGPFALQGTGGSIGVPADVVAGVRTIDAASTFSFTSPLTISAGARLTSQRTNGSPVATSSTTVRGALEIVPAANFTSTFASSAAVAVIGTPGGPAPAGELRVDGLLDLPSGGVTFGGAGASSDATTWIGLATPGPARVAGTATIAQGTTTVAVGSEPTLAGNLAVLVDGTLILAGRLNVESDVTVAPAAPPAAAGQITGTGPLALTGSVLQTVSGQISVPVITQQGPGGKVGFGAGTTTINGDFDLGAGCAVINVGGQLDVMGRFTAGANAALTLDGVLTTTLGCELTGTPVTISGNGRVDGPARVLGGTATIAAASAPLFTGALTIASGATLESMGQPTASGAIAVSGVLHVLDGASFFATGAAPAITLTGGAPATLDVDGPTGVLETTGVDASGAGSARFDVDGTLSGAAGAPTTATTTLPTTLDGDGQYVAAFSVNGATTTFAATSAASFPLGAPFDVAAGASLVVDGDPTFNDAATVRGVATLSPTAAVAATSIAGFLVDGGALTLAAGATLTPANELRFMATSTFDGAGQVVGGVLVLTGTTTILAGATPAMGTVSVEAGATLDCAGSPVASGLVSIAGLLHVTSTGLFTAAGGGTLTAGGTGASAAHLDVDAGGEFANTGALTAAPLGDARFTIDGTLTAGSLQITAQTTLDGDGSYAAPVTVSGGASAAVAAGASPTFQSTIDVMGAGTRLESSGDPQATGAVTVTTGATLATIAGSFSANAAAPALLVDGATLDIEAPVTAAAGATFQGASFFVGGSSLNAPTTIAGGTTTIPPGSLPTFGGTLGLQATSTLLVQGQGFATGAVTVTSATFNVATGGSFDAQGAATALTAVGTSTLQIDGTLTAAGGVASLGVTSLGGTGDVAADFDVITGTTTLVAGASLDVTNVRVGFAPGSLMAAFATDASSSLRALTGVFRVGPQGQATCAGAVAALDAIVDAPGGAFAFLAASGTFDVGRDLTVDGDARFDGPTAVQRDLAVTGSCVTGPVASAAATIHVVRNATITGAAALLRTDGPTALDVDGDFSVAGGTFRAHGGEHRFGGAFACSGGGALDHLPTTTFVFDGATPVTIGCPSLPGARVEKTGATATFPAFTTLSANLALVSGALVVDGGTVFTSGQFLASGGTFETTNFGVLDVKQGVSFASGASATADASLRVGGDWAADAGFVPTSGLVVFDGASRAPAVLAQALGGAGGYVGPLFFRDVAVGIGSTATFSNALQARGFFLAAGALLAAPALAGGGIDGLEVRGDFTVDTAGSFGARAFRHVFAGDFTCRNAAGLPDSIGTPSGLFVFGPSADFVNNPAAGPSSPLDRNSVVASDAALPSVLVALRGAAATLQFAEFAAGSSPSTVAGCANAVKLDVAGSFLQQSDAGAETLLHSSAGPIAPCFTLDVKGDARFDSGEFTCCTADDRMIAQGDFRFAGGAVCATLANVLCLGDWLADEGFAPAQGEVELRGDGTVAATNFDGILHFSGLRISAPMGGTAKRRTGGTFRLQAGGASPATTVIVEAGAELAVEPAFSGGVVLLRSIDASYVVNGALTVAGGGVLELGATTAVTIPTTATLRLRALASEARATIRGFGGANGWALNVAGTLDAERFLLEDMGAGGVVVQATATVTSFTDGILRRATAPPGTSVLLDLRRPVGPTPFVASSIQFGDAGTPTAGSNQTTGALSVRTQSVGAPVRFENWSGTLGGDFLDDDPFEASPAFAAVGGKVQWGVQAATVLASFTALAGASRVTATWTTESETPGTTFSVERGTAPTGPFAVVDVVPCTGAGFYACVDAPAAPGTTFHYRLMETAPGGATRVLAVASATPFAASFASAANVYEVGPGMTYATVQDAVNAAAAGPAGGVVRLVPGTYASFAVTATPERGLKIFADGGPVVIDTTNGPVRFVALGAAERVELRGLQIGVAASAFAGVSVEGCACPIVLNDCVVTGGAGAPGVVATSSFGLALENVVAAGTPGVRLAGASNAAAWGGSTNALEVLGGSKLRSTGLVAGAVVVDAPSTHLVYAGVAPRLEVPAFASLATPVNLAFTAEPLAPWLLVAALDLRYLPLPGTPIDMPLMVDPVSVLFVIEGGTNGLGAGSFLALVPADPALIGYAPAFQALAFLPSSATYRFSNVASAVVAP